MPVKPGDGVVYGKYDGTEILIDGVRHSLIRDSDILVKYTGGKLTKDSVEAINESVLVSVETKETSTGGGLLLASTNSDDKRPSTGTVIKVGPGRMSLDGSLLPMKLDVGDVVKFRDFAGNEVKIGDDDFTVVKITEIMAKF
jgi:chaperonin GroES